MLVQTVKIERYPTEPSSCFGVVPACPACDFAGQALALNAGKALPPEGTLVEAERIGGRLVFVYG